MSAEFDQLVKQFEQFQAKLQRVDDQFTSVGQMQEEIAALEVAATSPDRSVTVMAGPGGSITDIRFTDAALRQSAHGLSAAVMGALRQAVAEVARRQAGIVETHMGSGMNLVDQVLDTQAQLFGTTPEQLRASLEQEPVRPTDEDDDLEPRALRRDEPQRGFTAPPPVDDPSHSRFRNLHEED